MADTDAYREIFLSESADFLQQITDGLLQLEADPSATRAVEAVFRGTHSLKGMSGAMSYERTGDLAHKMESVIERVRSGALRPTNEVIDLMLKAVDEIRKVIAEESSGRRAKDVSSVAEQLAQLGARSSEAPSEAENRPHQTHWAVDVVLEEGCALKGVRAHLVIKRVEELGRIVRTAPSMRALENEEFGQSFRLVLASSADQELVRQTALGVGEVADVAVSESEADESGATEPDQPRGPSRRGGSADAPTVRVPIERLDHLVDLVGELVVVRSRLQGLIGESGELKEAFGQLQRISSDLQYEVMRARMVPVGTVFNRFPRMVRDLSRELGKKARLRTRGLDIELDRSVLDAITDPLVHLIRNSLDHGIGTPEMRRAARKPEEGLITLVASRERDHVAITVADDGRGIDVERVRTRAEELGLLPSSSRSTMGDDDVLQFIYAPGFSTAERATRVSGRGVGLDVVKAKIEQLGGSVEVSTSAEGTSFVVRLPQTVAIIHALLVSSGGQTSALPLSSVEEVFSADDLRIDRIDGTPTIVLRSGDVVPIHRLDATLFGKDPDAPPEPGTSIVLVRSGTSIKALHVDGLRGRAEIVVKPLSELLKNTIGLSGAAVTGDGDILLVIDPRTIFTE